MGNRLVLGLGGTVDYEIVWDPAPLEALVRELGITSAELSTAVRIESERDLVVSVLAFVRDGVGGERFVASSDIVERFAGRFRSRITLGGTCVRAAIAMDKLGVPSTVHLVSIDDHVRRLLPPGVAYVSSATHDTTDPHLIVQFPRGARVTAGDVDVVAAHPNRLIYTNDLPNRELVIADDLGDALAGAEVFLVSGFNTIQDPATLAARVHALREHMRRLPPDAVVVYEDAGFHVPALAHLVHDRLHDLVDVHGMNEDELQAYVGHAVDLLDAAAVAVALDELAAVVPARTLVVHTKYWSLAFGEEPEKFRAALRGGITMASTRFLGGDGFTAGDYRAVGGLPEHPDGRTFAAEIEGLLPGDVACVPAYVLTTDSPTTIGLGDTFVGGFVAALAGELP